MPDLAPLNTNGVPETEKVGGEFGVAPNDGEVTGGNMLEEEGSEKKDGDPANALGNEGERAKAGTEGSLERGKMPVEPGGDVGTTEVVSEALEALGAGVECREGEGIGIGG
jgi:hypothetical protein